MANEITIQDAANAVCNMFTGQPFRAPAYMMDFSLGNSPRLKLRISQALTTRLSSLPMTRIR